MKKVVSGLKKKYGKAIANMIEFRGEHALVVKQEKVKDLLKHCRDDLGFDYLIDICSVDHLGDEPRFEIVYELSRLASGEHLRIKCLVAENEKPETVSDLWSTANWHEREIYDMMGIEFSGHPDLSRILMWEGYPYFPLRKDFPLGGKPSEMPDVAFSDKAPLAGGPFVTAPTDKSTVHREPRSREV
jgi:NADH-quinone oxidoreductase subunit C